MPNPVEKLLRFFNEPAKGYEFAIEIDGILVSAFRKATGLKETINYRQINSINSSVVIHVKESVTTGDVTIEQGVAFGDSIFEWFKQCRDHKQGDDDPRKSISIIQLKKIRGIPFECDRYDLTNCFVKDYIAQDLDSENESISVSKIVIGREGFIQKPLDVLNDVTQIATIIGGYAQYL